MFRRLVLSMASIALLAIAGPAVAANSAPLGYQLLCLKAPAECKGGGASEVVVTAAMLATIKRVNATVNRQIAPRHDQGTDRWNANATSVGDCEDYVLAKRKALLRAGLPSSALRIAYVKTQAGVGHAVLVVNGSTGDLVLDNLSPAIRSLKQTGYRLVSMSGADPRKWN